jgi:hypothetical protein
MTFTHNQFVNINKVSNIVILAVSLVLIISILVFIRVFFSQEPNNTYNELSSLNTQSWLTFEDNRFPMTFEYPSTDILGKQVNIRTYESTLSGQMQIGAYVTSSDPNIHFNLIRFPNNSIDRYYKEVKVGDRLESKVVSHVKHVSIIGVQGTEIEFMESGKTVILLYFQYMFDSYVVLRTHSAINDKMLATISPK